MKHTKFWMRATLFALCLITLVSFVSCAADMDIGNNTKLAEAFLSHVSEDDYDAAYAMVCETVNDADFKEYWQSIQALAKDASSYDMKQIGWYVTYSDGLATRTTAYQVNMNNGKIALFRIITRDGIAGIAGLHFSDVTAFQSRADVIVPIVRIILTVVSLLSIAFVIWMFVDCLRRKIKMKVLWAILIFVGIAFSLTVGEENLSFKFFVGLILQIGTIRADPSTFVYQVKVIVPVGAILYLCLRPKLILLPPTEDTPHEKITESEEKQAETYTEENEN